MAAELAIAEETERRRAASDLHDYVGQLLGMAKVKLGEALAAGRTSDGPSEMGGLGLISARQRLEALRGSFDVDSGSGRGTRIVLTVPARR